jgi:peroxiredoxin
VAQLCHRTHELERANADVLLISFGRAELARAWQAEACPAFEMVLDPERKAYRVYGLKHSWWRSASLGTFWFTLRRLLSGQKWRGITSDPAQLGGDFIIDTNGIVKMAHPSRDPLDRPDAAEILACLSQV